MFNYFTLLEFLDVMILDIIFLNTDSLRKTDQQGEVGDLLYM